MKLFSSHLRSLHDNHVGIHNGRQLNITNVAGFQWYNVHASFDESQ
jgi:hypothetical protein